MTGDLLRGSRAIHRLAAGSVALVTAAVMALLSMLPASADVPASVATPNAEPGGIGFASATPALVWAVLGFGALLIGLIAAGRSTFSEAQGSPGHVLSPSASERIGTA